ncbi:hypothetical protein [Pseudomonas segetis]|uniref:Uncharacterized protein n=1 Tax=Pseudomonas segetis TaxID=298908 RepID=A0A239BZF1_9PSED|nr:hypothetical protein [Pseudomonas segetis]SNS12523.1 hypothetical protein SAMN05216255_1390 [Pseudomonas segetis]
MHRFLILAVSALLTACASTAPSEVSSKSAYEHSVASGSSPMAKTTLEALHNAEAIPLPVNPGVAVPSWTITADQPRLDFGSSISNYRVFSLALKKGEHFNLNVNSRCNNSCLGVSKFAIKPRAMLLDSYGVIIASKPSHASASLGQMSMGWEGEAPESGTYYLLVAADNEDIGKTIVIDDVWLNNSPLMSVKVGMNSQSLDETSAFSNTLR